MGIIYSMLSVFFVNYIICALFRRFGGVNRAKWNLIVMSIADLLIIVDLILTALIFPEFLVVLDTIFNVLGVVVMYVVSYVYLLDRHFSFNRRARKFENAKEGKTGKTLLTTSIVMGLIFLVGVALLCTNVTGDVVKTVISLLLMLTPVTIFLIIVFKNSVKKSYILLIKTPTRLYIYEKESSKINYSDFGMLGELYIVEQTGIVTVNKKKEIVYSIEVENVAEDVLDSINMNKSSKTYYSKIYSKLSRSISHLELDENYQLK